MKSICVIGATSPLGVTLVPALAAAGYSVRSSYRDQNLVPDEWHDEQNVHPFHLELKSGEPLGELAGDAIVWLAHLDAGRDNEAEPATNLRAFERVLERVAVAGFRKFVFVSSGGSVYGHPNSTPIAEDHERNAISSYGIAKKALEDRLLKFGDETGIATAILRPGNIYGFERPGRRTKGVIGAFLNALVHGTPFTLIHGGRTVRDMVQVDDVCRAAALAIESDGENDVWNVGTGRGIEVIEVLNMILERSGRQMPETENRENFASDVLVNILSPEKIRHEAAWQPTIGLDEGLDRTLEYWGLRSRSTEAGI